MSNAILLENPNIFEDWRSANNRMVLVGAAFDPPKSVKKRVSSETLVEIRQGKQLACVDMVLCASRPDGEGVVALSRRRSDGPFGGVWWIYGGSLGAYQPVDAFIARRAYEECGVFTLPQVAIGVYQTSWNGELPQSTIQMCYASKVEYEYLIKNLNKNEEHVEVKIFTAKELQNLSDELEWYPKRVCGIALQNMPLSSKITIN